MRVHAFNTATIRVKKHYVRAANAADPVGRWRMSRLTAALLDSEWQTIPTFAWAIEHPEGLIVVDVGESVHINDPDFFPPALSPYFRSQFRWEVSPEREIGAQMKARGLSPADVRWIVLTHTHFDHTDALDNFPNAEVVVSRREWETVQRWRSGHFAFPDKWPPSLRFYTIDYPAEPLGSGINPAFTHSYPLTQAGDVRLVPTPGHTLGHQSVVLHDGADTFFFAGDTSFDLPGLFDGTLDAPAFNTDVDLATRANILALARTTPLIYLTTHDFETENRLNARTPIAAPIAANVVLEHADHADHKDSPQAEHEVGTRV